MMMVMMMMMDGKPYLVARILTCDRTRPNKRASDRPMDEETNRRRGCIPRYHLIYRLPHIEQLPVRVFGMEVDFAVIKSGYNRLLLERSINERNVQLLHGQSSTQNISIQT